MTKPTRIFKHSSAGTDWAALLLGAAGWLCDALATAVMVGGQESVKWFEQLELALYRVFAVNRDEESSWEI
jgi:thiamine biosynthesis lipoprotein